MDTEFGSDDRVATSAHKKLRADSNELTKRTIARAVDNLTDSIDVDVIKALFTGVE